MIETGMRVPTDCLLIEGADLSVDEKYYDPDGEREIKNKNEATKDNMSENPDPFILTQSLVESGSGKALVCAVGLYSRRGNDAVQTMEENNDETPLQEKLDNVAT